jgi:DNA-binding response OmpR family regulator
MSRILIVEDEPAMQRGLRDNLEVEGYEVETAGDGETGLQQILSQQFDLIILDVMLPKVSGFDVCRKAREKGVTTPIIMLTAKGEEIDKVVGLELGADDYITKPFGLREFLARIKAVLRRQGGDRRSRGGPVRIADAEVDFATYTALRAGKEISMTPKEFEVLMFLWENRNATVSRDQLLTEVWKYDDSVSTRTIDNFILKLRQKIEPDPSRPRHIITIHGIGYKLIAD